MFRKLFWTALIAVLLLPIPAAVAAQSLGPAERGPWEISAFAGALDDRYEFDPDGSAIFFDPDGNVLFGAALRYHTAPGFSIGLEGRYMPALIRPRNGTQSDLDVMLGSGLVGYTIPIHDLLDIHGAAGVTAAYWSPENVDAELDFGFTYGGGLRIYATEQVALIGDFRMFHVPSAMEDVGTALGNVTPDQYFSAYSVTAGISLFLGKKDSDGDGVRDGDDACPDTPRGVEVDAMGCAVDSDGDGVADYQDDCPGTPQGATVNAQGCPTDGDGDGVYDGLDRCPDTPMGAEVDEQGCALDTDGDGVPNGIDACPNTPAGDEVDSEGCTIVEEPEPEPRMFNFEGVNFEFNSATLTAQGEEKLRAIGDTIVTYLEEAGFTLVGHTDSIGSAEYNMTLSRERAQSVRAFLVQNFPETQGMFTVRAMGESQPVADNGTEEGRAMNRRVEIIINR